MPSSLGNLNGLEDHHQFFKAADINLRSEVSNSNDPRVRSIPELIDYNARVNPETLFCYQALKSADTSGDTDVPPPMAVVNMVQLRDAVWRCSQRLLQELGISHESKTPTGKPAPVALFMDSDLSLLIHLFALMALGTPVALLSARLSTVAVQHLADTIQAQAIIVSPRTASVLKPLETGTETSVGSSLPKLHVAKSFQHDLRAAEETPENGQRGKVTICAPDHYVGEQDRNVLILHSSGTTGLPKAIFQSHKYLLGYASCHIRTDEEDIGALNMSTLPLYHGFGLVVPCLTLGIGKPFLLPPPHTVPTGLSTANALRQFGCKSLMTVPHILDEMVALPPGEGVDALLPLQFVACGGGPLKLTTGEKLAAAGVKLLAHFGTTEIGPLAPIFAPSEDYDWRYWRLRDDYRITVEPVEQQPEQQQNTTAPSAPSSGQHYQLTALPFGWDTPFVLQDWLVTSDRNPGRDFRAMGRKDDLIVLITGEKVPPQILESALCQSELVKGAVAFGDGQFELGVVVERADTPDTADVDTFKALLWPIVAEAGRQMDSHARISSLASIVVTGPEKPLPRSDKGSVLRKEAYRIFEEEIKKAYQDLELTDSDGDSSLDPDALEDSLKKLVQAQMQDAVPEGVWGAEDDLFELGVNSLQAARISRAIKRALRKEGMSNLVPADKIGADFVYKNPTISQMGDALRLTSSRRELSEEAMIDSYVSRYSGLVSKRRHVVLLTGSSGTLGSYALQHLVALPHVSEVICLVRKGRHSAETNGDTDYVAAQIQKANSKGANIPTEYAPKVTVIQADPFQDRLGLQGDEYRRLAEKVDHIFHCAWPVDFQRSISSFENQFRFLQNLVQLSANANELQGKQTRLLFVSSIAVVGQYHRSHGSRIVPEEVMEGARSTNDFGYGKAKLVCEKILANVADELRGKVEVASVRLGQISGARTSGIWNSREHFPALVRLSQTIKAFPKLQGTLSWLPVDVAATTISDVLLSPQPLDLIYHVENPLRQDWYTVMSTIAEGLGFPPSSALVSFDEWVAKAEGSALVRASGYASVAMLMDFFKHDFERMASGGVVLDTSKARQASLALRNVEIVEREEILNYVRNWRRSGFLDEKA
ncbi:hypothetical protein F5144DRAFT_495138 [Chaetomium tenue]|uniref:Uncharacterized protein n=1 Tax=Chaetomium tenue TaxID=1854479 RepID=A0ACB7NZP7_9PEZI|nr:hypothetical protein F5144DRAFT_495138 [Chaetomium globosum]